MDNITYIKFNSHGFWIHQAFVEVLSDYICQTFEDLGVDTFSENLKKIYRICDSNRLGENIGMVGIPFDRTITNNADKVIMLDILNQTKTLIASKGAELSLAMLEAFESRKTDDYFRVPWNFPIKTQSLIATIDIIIKVLNGTWTSDNYSVYFVGFPNISQQEEI
ncbi:hypothetical protein [Mucilaginibacter sp. L3T2-6]|uniref:hypothetical protein n=1 Tax=Mucilaginibacter sp. L3T2-6 TaxID=3062491 RepID=UPI002675AB8F|nr:hypothetical protein [Mucilaginibacter sp. L3T2-6]MDO3641331.1 hypothetical protein [Mucilaginibacter sp. L3T2-6]MDV6213908.1 hypothetical protein [Mucilaginibacter sp. L3T2-6]